MSYVIAAVGFLCFVGLIVMIYRKIAYGSSCCGEHEKQDVRIKPADRNKAHYPYHYKAEISGMVCANCAVKVENAFNRNSGIMAQVNLSDKTADIFSKHLLKHRDVLNILQDTQYVLINFEEVHHEAK